MSDSGFRYPPPSNALTLWFDGNSICVGIAPSSPEGRGHTVRLPLAKCSIECSEGGTPLARQLGWRALRDLLTAAYHAGQGAPRAKISEPAAPSLYQIEQALRASGPKLGSGPAGRTTLADLGLD